MKRVAFLIILLTALGCQKEPDLDILIINGNIATGLLEAPKIGAIGIKGDKIVFVGEIPNGKSNAKQTIDATGKWVTPGFIDPHTHAMRDLSDTVRNANLPFLYQGVTTVFVGSDGRSPIDLEEQFQRWETQGIGTNAVTYIGHNSVRKAVLNMQNRPPDSTELAHMKTIVQKGMEAGAIGLSSGLYYAPGSYAETEEVIELAKIVAEYGGCYDVHMRDESTYNIGLIAAVEETIEIAEKAGIPGHIAHIKCLGVDVWNQSDTIIKIIESARARGLDITADQYPYVASGTSITGALIPRWALADDPDPKPKFKDPILRARIIKDMKENMRKRGGPETLLLTFPSKTQQDLKGMTLANVAEQWQMSPIDAAIEIFLNGGSSVGSFNMQESDLKNFMQQDWVMTGSDGSNGHPRKYGTFPKKIRKYVIEEGVISLNEMIHRSTYFPAKTFQLKDRGLLKSGNFADVIIFDPNEVKDHATFEEPTALSSGMEFVIVNGNIAIQNGQFTGVKAGRGLRHKKP